MPISIILPFIHYISILRDNAQVGALFYDVFFMSVTELLAAAAAHREAIITCLAGGGW